MQKKLSNTKITSPVRNINLFEMNDMEKVMKNKDKYH